MSINKRQFFALFTASIFFWVVFQALLAMLPVYAVRLGADESSTGNYLSFAFLALAAGGILSGWLIDKLQHRKTLLITMVILNIPFIWAMGQVETFEQLIPFTGIVFFISSIGLSMTVSLAGLSSGEDERGKVYGALNTTGSIGAFIAGMIAGVIVNRLGFPMLFAGAVLCWALQLVIIVPFVEDKTVTKHPHTLQPQSSLSSNNRSALGGTFYLLLLANLLAFSCNFVPLLGRPLQMDVMGFDPEAISAIVAIGGAVSIPLPFFFGWLSDRMNRYWVVAMCFLVSAIGLMVLAGSNALWLFAVSGVMLATLGASIGISQALVTDLVPPQSMGMALALVGASVQFGGVIGFASGGNAIETFGLATTYIGGTTLTLFSIFLLYIIQTIHNRQSVLHVPTSQ